MECKVGYIRGHGFSTLGKSRLPRKKCQKCCVGTLLVNSRPRAGDGTGQWHHHHDVYILSE